MRDGSRTRARILDEALLLFADKGVEATSVRDIARAVGVAESALYRHFAAKEDIAREAFLVHFAALARDVVAIGAEPAPLAARVRRLVDHFTTLFDERVALFTFVLINQHRHLGALPVDADSNPVSALSALLGVAMEKGELPRGNPDLAAAVALGIVIQPAVFRLYGRLEPPLSRHAPALAAAVLSALGVHDEGVATAPGSL
ncbi:TetR/AcrR family transcriptional regulator [Alsobacter sp. R-9]